MEHKARGIRPASPGYFTPANCPRLYGRGWRAAQAFLSGDLARWRGVLEGELTKLYPHRKARCGWCGSDGAEALRPSAAWAGTDRTWDGTGGRRAPSQQAEVEVRPAVKGTG